MTSKKRASNPTYVSPRQLNIVEFSTPFSKTLDPSNRWVVMSRLIPWDDLVKTYSKQMKTGVGRPGLNPRIVIGSLFIKHLCDLSDRDTIEHIQENIYMQYFLGYEGFRQAPPFDPSLFVEIRERLGMEGVSAMNEAIARAAGITGAERHKDPIKEDSHDDTKNKGRVLFDATVCPQDIAYPTDLSLLNQAREKSEGIIDMLYDPLIHQQKPRTYRNTARKLYLQVAKKKIKHKKVLRNAIGRQLRYLKRNLKSIDRLLDALGTAIPLGRGDYKDLLVIGTLYQQQLEMFHEKKKSIEDRIVSIHQPHVRPMVRGKSRIDTEFGAKINVSLIDGYSFIDELSWSAFHEGRHLKDYIEQYRTRFGYYPKEVLADKIYCNRENRTYLKERGIRLLAQPLGRPSAVNKIHISPGDRNPIEGKFGQAKRAYGLDKIKARSQQTSQTWIAMILLTVNLVRLTRAIPPALKIKFVIYFSATLERLLSIQKNISRIHPYPAYVKIHY